MVCRTKVALQPRVRVGRTELIGFGAQKSGRPMRVRDTETLIDLRIEPQFGALPQPHAGIKRRIVGLATLARCGQTVGPLVGRSHCRVALPDKRGLAVQAKPIQIRDPWRHCCPARRRRSAEPVIQTGAQLLQCEIRGEALSRGRKQRAAVAVAGKQIFETRGPVRRHRHLDAGAACPAQSPQERRVGRTACQLRHCQPVVRPGETASRIKQPVAGRITDARPYRAERQHRFAVALRAAGCWREKRRGAANGDARKIRPCRERCIHLGADDHAVREHIIVAGLKPGEEASRLAEGVERLIETERAGDAGRRHPIRASPTIAEMTAEIKSIPVIGDGGARWRRLGQQNAIGRSAANATNDGGSRRGSQPKSRRPAQSDHRRAGHRPSSPSQTLHRKAQWHFREELAADSCGAAPDLARRREWRTAPDSLLAGQRGQHRMD